MKLLREAGELKKHLIIHLDNCGRENKNKWVFSFCCLILHWKWVREIELYFLFVGYTHAECDVMFISFGQSKKLPNSNVGSVRSMNEWIKENFE